MNHITNIIGVFVFAMGSFLLTPYLLDFRSLSEATVSPGEALAITIAGLALWKSGV